MVLGLALFTAGFFAVHGIASGWVPARAHAAGWPGVAVLATALLAVSAGLAQLLRRTPVLLPAATPY